MGNGYHYTIEYKPGPQNTNADAFSRLPLTTIPQEVPTPPEVAHLMECLEAISQVRMLTTRDPILIQSQAVCHV